jgi:hypothetical protein
LRTENRGTELIANVALETLAGFFLSACPPSP